MPPEVSAMPLYDYRCTTCGTVYELRRTMRDADGPAECPAGHQGAVRLIPVFATTGLAAAPGAGGMCGAPVAGGCGGGCACHAG
jgi:putative FmdB family regulatory protein